MNEPSVIVVAFLELKTCGAESIAQAIEQRSERAFACLFTQKRYKSFSEKEG